jgi:hypothetical protein
MNALHISDVDAPTKGDRDDTSSLDSLHRRLFHASQPASLFGHASQPASQSASQGQAKLKLPPLPQKYFVHLWRSLHDLVAVPFEHHFSKNETVSLGKSHCLVLSHSHFANLSAYLLCH